MTGPFRPPTGGPAGAPGQGGQPPVHPTVGTFGMPGGEVTHERPSYTPPAPSAGAPPGWNMPPAPAPATTFPQNMPSAPAAPPAPPAPHPTAPYGQVAPPPAAPPAPAAPSRAEIPDHVILDGASVPPELRGRSWGQIKQIYGALANDFVLRQNNGGRPPAPAAPAAPVYEQGRPNGGQPPAGRTGTFWEDPEGSIARIVDARIAPITQRTSAMAIQEARNVAASGIPDWNQLEAEVLTIVAGADASSLADPRLWQSTAELARGRLMGRGQYNYAPAGREGAAPGGAPPATRGPGVFAPAQTSPVGAFFTEAPTPPQNGQDGYGAATDMASRVSNLTAEQRQYAQKMLMSLEDYVAWQGGVIQTAPVRRY